MDTPYLLSIPKAAKRIGVDKEIVREWTRRAVDPLPTVPAANPRGVGAGVRCHRKVVMTAVPSWLERNGVKGGAPCGC